MCTVASKLSDGDITAIADDLSKKPFVRAKQTADAAQSGTRQADSGGPLQEVP